jgi:hypothetical protein
MGKALAFGLIKPEFLRIGRADRYPQKNEVGIANDASRARSP